MIDRGDGRPADRHRSATVLPALRPSAGRSARARRAGRHRAVGRGAPGPPGRPAGLARGDRRAGRRRPGRSARRPIDRWSGSPPNVPRWPTASVRRPPTGCSRRARTAWSSSSDPPGWPSMSPRCSPVPASGTSTTAPTAPSNPPTCPPAPAAPRQPGLRAAAGPRPWTPTSGPPAPAARPAGQNGTACRADPRRPARAGDGRPGRSDRRRAAGHGRTGAPAGWAGPARAVVGPLVLPGRSTCLHCADLHRADADPHAAAVARARRALRLRPATASVGRGHRRRRRPGPAAAGRRGTTGDDRRHAGVGSDRPIATPRMASSIPSVGVGCGRTRPADTMTG